MIICTNVGRIPIRRKEATNKTALPSNVFFLPILSAKYPPTKGVETPAMANTDPIHEISSSDKACPNGLSGPDEVSGGFMDDVQPIAIAEIRLEIFTRMTPFIDCGYTQFNLTKYSDSVFILTTLTHNTHYYLLGDLHNLTLLILNWYIQKINCASDRPARQQPDGHSESAR